MKHGETVGRQGSYPLIILIIWLETPYPSCQIVHSFRFEGNSSLPSASKGRSWRDPSEVRNSIFSIFTIHHGRWNFFGGVFHQNGPTSYQDMPRYNESSGKGGAHSNPEPVFFFSEVWRRKWKFFGSAAPVERCVFFFWKTYTKFNSPWFFCVFFCKAYW